MPERPPTELVSTLLIIVLRALSEATALSEAAGTIAFVSGRSGSWSGAGSWFLSVVMAASFLESLDRLSKRPHEFAPSGHRSVCVFGPHQRDAGAARNDEF